MNLNRFDPMYGDPLKHYESVVKELRHYAMPTFRRCFNNDEPHDSSYRLFAALIDDQMSEQHKGVKTIIKTFSYKEPKTKWDYVKHILPKSLQKGFLKPNYITNIEKFETEVYININNYSMYVVPEGQRVVRINRLVQGELKFRHDLFPFFEPRHNR